MANTPEFESLSLEARVMCAAYWGIMMTNELSFERPWIMTDQARNGLDELVKHEYLTVERFNSASNKLIWKPTDKLKAEKPRLSMEFLKANGFPITKE